MLIVFSTMALSAMLMTTGSLNPFKPIMKVSEDHTIPKFIDDYMKVERDKYKDIEITQEAIDKNKLGFKSISDANLDTLIMKNNIRLMFELYDDIFPNHRFVSFGCVDKLLETYNLDINFTENYTGEMPLANLNDINTFKYPWYTNKTSKDSFVFNTFKYSLDYSLYCERLYRQNFVNKQYGDIDPSWSCYVCPSGGCDNVHPHCGHRHMVPKDVNVTPRNIEHRSSPLGTTIRNSIKNAASEDYGYSTDFDLIYRYTVDESFLSLRDRVDGKTTVIHINNEDATRSPYYTSIYGKSMEPYKKTLKDTTKVKPVTLKESPKQLFIIAPKEKFNTHKKYEEVIIRRDPIVLFPVIGGYIIVTAW